MRIAQAAGVQAEMEFDFAGLGLATLTLLTDVAGKQPVLCVVDTATVDYHLRKVYRKLDVTRRSSLPGALLAADIDV